jgi:hypothetical protein
MAAHHRNEPVGGRAFGIEVVEGRAWWRGVGLVMEGFKAVGEGV